MAFRRNWIYFVSGGFGIGVLMRSFFYFGFSFSLLVSLLALVAFITCAITRASVSIYVALFVLGIAVGIVRFDIAELKTGDPFLNAHLEQELSLEGVVVDEPDERETNTKLTVRIDNGNGVSIKTNVLITTERYPRYIYGDRIAFTGKLTSPSSFVSDTGSIFDYKMYLKKDGIFYTMYNPVIEKRGSGEGNSIKSVLFSAKSSFLEQVGHVIEEPQASLLGGLVVGAKRSLGERLLNDFRTAGIIHIVVLSGYNVTIVAEFVMRLLSFLPLFFSWSIGAIVVIFFALMTGAGATIVRASIMAILVIIARATGRTYHITRALIVAGVGMVFYNPFILVFDSSFQLSFMATIGLIHLAPELERYFGWVPTRLQLREFATATVATQLFVLPMLLYKMGQLSIVAFPVNLLVLPAVPVTMLLGFLTGAVGFLNTALSLPFAYATEGLLSYQLFIVDAFAKIPFASVSINAFPLWAAVSMYGVYGLILWWFYTQSKHS